MRILYVKELLGSSPTETYQRYRWQEDASKRMVFVEERGCVSHHWENRARQAVGSGGECVSVLSSNPGQGLKAVLQSLLKALLLRGGLSGSRLSGPFKYPEHIRES